MEQLEKENKSLEHEDTTLEENNVKIGNLEKEIKTLFKEIAVYKEFCILLKELEKENKEFVERASIDIKTLVTLREDLKSTLKKSLEIKEEKIAALEARLEESTNYNQHLRQELKIVKKIYEALKQRQDEERMVQSSPPTSGEDNKWE
ncbi:hypothetical protein MC885_013581 [Smutsia gigantea]|nr:hypothetical protein MC885_013581 [Smutsia gigantea]